jgi:hypothetical protein
MIFLLIINTYLNLPIISALTNNLLGNDWIDFLSHKSYDYISHLYFHICN